jgi:zinc transport system permease protein
MIALWHQALQALPGEWAQYAFMRQALLAIVLITPVCALLGCLVINKHMAFFSDAVGHSALTGIACGVLLGVAQPRPAMLLFAVVFALGISVCRRYAAASLDTIIGMAMASSVALGIVILSRQGGFQHYTAFLIGDILTVTPDEIRLLAGVAGVVLISMTLLFNRLLLTSVSGALAISRGVPVWLLDTLLALLVALFVMLCIPWIGLLVINSLLLLPAAAARNIARSTRGYVAWAIAIGLMSGVAGVVLSYYWATATGATIVLVAAALFVLSLSWPRRSAWTSR